MLIACFSALSNTITTIASTTIAAIPTPLMFSAPGAPGAAPLRPRLGRRTIRAARLLRSWISLAFVVRRLDLGEWTTVGGPHEQRRAAHLHHEHLRAGRDHAVRGHREPVLAREAHMPDVVGVADRVERDRLLADETAVHTARDAPAAVLFEGVAHVGPGEDDAGDGDDHGHRGLEGDVVAAECGNPGGGEGAEGAEQRVGGEMVQLEEEQQHTHDQPRDDHEQHLTRTSVPPPPRAGFALAPLVSSGRVVVELALAPFDLALTLLELAAAQRFLALAQIRFPRVELVGRAGALAGRAGQLFLLGLPPVEDA